MAGARVMKFSIATLVMTEYGVAKGVVLDGHKLPNIVSARVVMEPHEVTKLLVEINISNVITEYLYEAQDAKTPNS
jgi:hypothetical protein